MTPKNSIYPDLVDKKVIVTGGATGIGSVITKFFYEQGAQVFILDILKEESYKLINLMPSNLVFKQPKFFYCDLIKTDSINSVFKEIYDNYGALDVLCNNAADDERHDWQKISSQEWDYYQNINLKSQFFCIREFVKFIDGANGASIICMGSISYLNGTVEIPSYSVAKSGLIGLINTMAKILGKRKIRINLIQPGWIMTKKQLQKWIDKDAKDLISEKQLLEGEIYPEEPARLVLFLASDQSKMITKQVINVDGGWV